MDFYVYKGLYVGTELGFTVGTDKTCLAEKEIESSYINKTEKYDDVSKSVHANFYVVPCVRLGWSF